MKHFLFVLFFSISFCSYAQQKQLCITVDDLPFVTYGSNDPKLLRSLTEKLVHAFNKHQIPAIGYVNEIHLYSGDRVNEAKVDLLRIWLKNGYELGNHTFSHTDFNKVTTEVYFNEILKGEIITKKLMKEYGKELNYFRHPYLHLGTTKNRYDSLSTFLAEHHYTLSPVTIDNEEYLFAKAYHKAYVAHNHEQMEKIGKLYLDYMEKKILFFEQKTIEVFNAPIVQTLLIHANMLNADYMDALATMYEKNGYTFVSQETALKDSAYTTPVSTYTRKGISWIYRWGFSKGMSEKLMEGDVEVPKFE